MRDYIACLLKRLPEEEAEENWSLPLETEIGPMPPGDTVEDMMFGTGLIPPMVALSNEDILGVSDASLAADVHRTPAAHLVGQVAGSGEVWSKATLEKSVPPLLFDADESVACATELTQVVDVNHKLETGLKTLDAVRKQTDLDALETVGNRGLPAGFGLTHNTVLLEKWKPVRKKSVLWNVLEAMQERVDRDTRKTSLERIERTVWNTASERVDLGVWKGMAEWADLEALEGAVKRAVGEEPVVQSKKSLLWGRLQQEGRLARFAAEGGRERIQSTSPTPLPPAWGTQTDLSALDRAAERDARGYDRGFSLF